MKDKLKRIVLILTMALLPIACSKDDSPKEPEPQNLAPVANAGDDRQVEIGSVVKLDASGSKDPDGDDLTYKWSFLSIPEGSTTTIIGVGKEQAEFTMDRAGAYEVRLQVSDGVSESSDSFTISNKTPIIESIRPNTFLDDDLPDEVAERGERIIISGKFFFGTQLSENKVTIGGIICETEKINVDPDTGTFFLYIKVADDVEPGELRLTIGAQSTSYEKGIRILERPVYAFVNSDDSLVESQRNINKDTYFEVGMTFIPLVNGEILAMGIRAPLRGGEPRITLWDVESGQHIISQDSRGFGFGSSEHTWNLLGDPVVLMAGKEYRLTMFINNWYIHGYQPRENIYPRTHGNIEILNTVTTDQPYDIPYTDFNFPDFIVENYLIDAIDIVFVPDLD